MANSLYSSGSGTKSDPFVLNSNQGKITLSPGKYYILPKGAVVGYPGTGNNDANGGIDLHGANLVLADGSQANGIIDISKAGSNLDIEGPQSDSDMVQSTYNPGKAGVGGETWTYPQTQNAAIKGLLTNDDQPNTASSIVSSKTPTTNNKSFGILGTFENEDASVQGSEFAYNTHYRGQDGINFGYQVIVPDNSSVLDQNSIVIPHSQADNGDFVTGNTGSTAYVCFLAGAMIRLADGSARAVEEIAVGDVVETVINGEKATTTVTWTGSRFAWTKGNLPADEAGFPVIVRTDAIAPGIPSSDLRVTSEHCLFIDGGFVPVRMLVNGGSIAYDMTKTSYYYYHIETEKHAVVFANDCATESYLDTGNRAGFNGSDTIISFKNKTWEDDAAASLLTSPDRVAPIHAMLAERARALGYQVNAVSSTTMDDDLKLEASNGMVIRPLRRAGKTAVFHIPSGLTQLTILSNAARPADVIGPFHDDRRVLGVKISRASLMVDGGNTREIARETLASEDGWYQPEINGVWTNGHAVLDLTNEITHASALLMLEIAEGGPYLEIQDRQQAEVRRRA